MLCRPQVTALDNQLAQISVGQTVPIVNGVSVTGLGGEPRRCNRKDVGILLVTPRIRADGTSS